MGNMKNLLNARNANARHHEHNDGQGRNIARKGTVAKTSNDEVALHPNMTSLQKAGAGSGGMGHPTATINDGRTIASSAAAAPLAHAYSGIPKPHIGKPVAPVPGMRSRTNEADCDCEDEDCDCTNEDYATKQKHGRDMLAQALKN